MLFEQVFVNLLENAIKYAGGAASIEIAATRVGDSVSTEVADNGVGIAIGTEQALFEKFFRGDPGAAPGAGLGLAICKAIATAHGGSISAASRKEGGARFVIVVPIGGSPPAIEPSLA